MSLPPPWFVHETKIANAEDELRMELFRSPAIESEHPAGAHSVVRRPRSKRWPADALVNQTVGRHRVGMFDFSLNRNHDSNLAEGSRRRTRSMGPIKVAVIRDYSHLYIVD